MTVSNKVYCRCYENCDVLLSEHMHVNSVLFIVGYFQRSKRDWGGELGMMGV